MIMEKGIQINEHQVRSISTSCISLYGLKLLRDEIVYWIAENGIQGIGTK